MPEIRSGRFSTNRWRPWLKDWVAAYKAFLVITKWCPVLLWKQPDLVQIVSSSHWKSFESHNYYQQVFFSFAYCQIKMDHYLLIYYTVSLHNLSPKCTNLRKDFSIQLTPNTVNNSSPQSDYTPLIFNAACNVSVPFDPQNVQKSSSFWGKFLFPLWAESVSFSSIWWH